MLTVQQAAGTQFHFLLSVHSVLIQGELYPIKTKKKKSQTEKSTLLTKY